MQRAPELAYTFAVRAHAPTTLVLANLGLVQAVATPTAEIARARRATSAPTRSASTSIPRRS